MASDAPEPTREVIAEGSAAISGGGLSAARKAAIAQALRSAVEKAAGVYVSARTLTQNYQLLQDQVVTHTDGFATLSEVLHETDAKTEVRVQIRAQVSLRPLAKQLKALNLTRQWRVHVSGVDADSEEAKLTIQATLEKSLTDSGLVIVSTDREADVLITSTLRPVEVQIYSDPVDDSHHQSVTPTLRDDISIRVTFAPTGEVLTALTATGVSHKIDSHEARLDAANTALEPLLPKLTDTLLLLPAHDFQPVQLAVGKIGSASRAALFEEALRLLPNVASVTRRRYEQGNGLWEIQITPDTQGSVAGDLEENPAIKSYGLTVLSQTPLQIVAATNGVAPVFGSDKDAPKAPSDAFPNNSSNASTDAPANSTAEFDINTVPVRRSASVSPDRNVAAAETVSPVPRRHLPPVYDDFSYKPGQELPHLNGGAGWSVPWYSHSYGGSPTVIVTGNLLYQNLATSGNAIMTPSNGSIENDREWSMKVGRPGTVIYASLLMRPLDGMNDGRPYTYFQWNIGDIAIGKPGSDSHISLEHAGPQGGGVVPTHVIAVRYATYFLVVRVTFGEKQSLVDLWVNPMPGRPLLRRPDATRIGNFTTVDRFASGTNIRCVFDEYRVGNTFDEVAPTR